jgi:hypothetical protein
MPYIVLNDDQTKVVFSSMQPVQIRDQKGNVLGCISPIWTEGDIADAKGRLSSNEPRFTTEQVLAYLQSLEQI